MDAVRKQLLSMSENTAEDAIIDAAIANGVISDEELAAAEELEGLAGMDNTGTIEEYSDEDYPTDDDEDDEEDYGSDGSEFFHDVEDEDDEVVEYPIEAEDINDNIAMQGMQNPFMYEAARMNDKLRAIIEEAEEDDTDEIAD